LPAKGGTRQAVNQASKYATPRTALELPPDWPNGRTRSRKYFSFTCLTDTYNITQQTDEQPAIILYYSSCSLFPSSMLSTIEGLHHRDNHGMNTSIRVTRIRHRLTSLLAILFLIQIQGISHAGYSVQVGAFKNHDLADRLSETLRTQGYTASVIVDNNSPDTLSLVRIGPYPRWKHAEEARQQLESSHIDGFLVQTSSPTATTMAGNELQEIKATQRIMLAASDDSEAGTTDSLTDLFGMETVEPEETAKPAISGFFDSKYAYTYTSPTHHSMFRNTLELQASDSFNEDISWKVSARGSYDAVFDIENFYSSRVEDNRQFEGSIRETYVDISAEDWEFRVGRQHIIWGEMVGLFFADVVSAKDLRQWVAEDFDMIRIPQWAVRAEHYKGDFHTEAIWIPFMTYNEIGKPGDDFYPLGTDPLPGFRQTIKSEDQPTRDPSNGAYGLRASMLKSGWDLSGFYYRSYDADPAFFRSIEAGPTPTIIYTPKHKKIHRLGATFAKDLANFLIKGEVVYTHDRRFITTDLNDADGVVKQHPLDYVIGLEYTTPDNTILNFQFFQRWYTNHDSDSLFDEFENGASFYSSMDLTSRLDGELLLISSLNREDWMLRPKLTWDLDDNWWFSVGADVFGGERKGLIGGRFDNSDRIYGQVRYTY
jgi:hypothetical protein